MENANQITSELIQRWLSEFDKDKAEWAVQSIYKQHNKKTPIIKWCKSPAELFQMDDAKD